MQRLERVDKLDAARPAWPNPWPLVPMRTTVGLIPPGRDSRRADVLLESNTAIELDDNGQRMSVDVTAITTLGRGQNSNPVKASDRVKHAKAGESAHVKEQERS